MRLLRAIATSGRGVHEEEKASGTTSVKMAMDRVEEERGNAEYVHIVGREACGCGAALARDILSHIAGLRMPPPSATTIDLSRHPSPLRCSSPPLPYLELL